MERKNRLALIVAFFLSKYDSRALEHLQLSGHNQAFEIIGEILGIKPSTIKNMRDGFDPLHNNTRAGWYQRELRPSRMEIIENFQHFSESAMIEVVKDILKGHEFLNVDIYTEYTKVYLNNLKVEDEKKRLKRNFNGNSIAIKKAQDIFIEEFHKGNILLSTVGLVDHRNYDCGYDFKLPKPYNQVFKIKGTLDRAGDITFSDKEWESAKKMRLNYILVFVSEINHIPKIKIIKDPFDIFSAKLVLQPIVSASWFVDSKQIIPFLLDK